MNRDRIVESVSGIALALGIWMSPAPARAGVPECGGIRLEDVKNCEIRGSVDCNASCDSLGVYKKACATKLHKVCRKDCTLAAEPTCTDECTEQCSSECARGTPITCTHNCFAECEGSCDASCDGAAEPERCRASCEATCDGECDVKCGAVAVDASCYTHCIECCGGSCGAQANMTCQTTCQDKEFEDCEYELRADCDASCTGSGALFCDGEFVLAAKDAVSCVKALSLRGIAEVDASVEIDVGGIAADSKGKAGCGFTGDRASAAWALALAGAFVALGARRRR